MLELGDFRNVFPEYADKQLYGALAYIIVDGHSNKMAEKLGYILINATGESAKIANNVGFKPKVW